MKNKMTYLLSLILLMMAAGCSKNEFSPRPTVSSQNVSAVEQYSSELCTNYTLSKPPVDFLFLWDNSSSQFFVTPETKAALNNTINFIAAHRFDYHIALAPLIPTTASSPFWLLADNPTGLSSSIISNNLISFEDAPKKLDQLPVATGSREGGIERARSLIAANVSNGVFRQNAYTIVVLMSNGNDNDAVEEGGIYHPSDDINYVNTKLPAMLSLRDSTLKSKMFRFVSLVAQSSCNSQFKIGGSYMRMSMALYGSTYPTGISKPTDQDSRLTADSYDICGADFSHIFDGINNSIASTVIAHKYNYWPITSNTSASFDPASITVSKIKPNGTSELITESDTDGFRYAGYLSNQNTRIEPSVGEAFTGYLVKLNGNAEVSYPDCIRVQTQAPFEYYGYFQLATKPLLSSIVLTINGQVVPQSTTNGWSYLGYLADQNIKVKSPTQATLPGTPAIRKTGYFLRLNGNAIYSNNSTASVKYQTTTN